MSEDNNNKNKKLNEESIIEQAANEEYRYGFVSDFETNVIPKGLNEDVVRRISELKNEPEWLLEFRLKAFRHWLTLPLPKWGKVNM
ncbi:MAG: Fe-S cluster assembly protein SufB, partial [Muribaculaceae bacterium]|nr:Fe-S cluster assembly protein SufB [Muribaculaceae bacterium]